MAARSPRFCSPDLGALQAQSCQHRTRIRRFYSYEERHADHAWCRKFESALHHRTDNRAAMRDLGPRNGETRTRTGDTTIFRV